VAHAIESLGERRGWGGTFSTSFTFFFKKNPKQKNKKPMTKLQPTARNMLVILFKKKL